MTEAEIVDVVHVVAFVAFWAFLFIGAISVSARVAWYRANGFRRPRLLSRDALFIGGFAFSFGLILAARVLELADLRDSLPWALMTDLPGVIGAGAFVYYELFVIERGRRIPSIDDGELARRLDRAVPSGERSEGDS